MRVAVLSGGRSSEHPVSIRSGEAVAGGLREAGHEVVEVTISRDGRWLSDGAEISVTPGAGLLGCDAAFPVLHGPGGEDGSVQGLLECLDLPYVGSDVRSSALCLDKLSFKDMLRAHGLPQVDYVRAGAEGWRDRVGGWTGPAWVKPSRLGSSVGIAKVPPGADLGAAVDAARRHDPRVIVEAQAPGAEVECSLLGHAEVIASVPGEIVANADWYDYEAKYESGGMELVVPARISPAATERVRELALEVFEICGCSGLGRCDFFVDGEEVLVNELNTIPGFTETSVYGKLLAESGIAYPDLCDRLVAHAFERAEELSGHTF